MTDSDRPPKVRIARNLVRLARAGEVLEQLSGVGIACLVLKGAAIFEAVGDLAAREMADVDILVRRADVDRVGAVLRQLGYRRFVSTGREWSAHWHYARAYLKDEDVGIDVHTRIAPDYAWNIDHRALFDRAVPLQLGRASARRLSNEDLLLHVALNAAKDVFPAADRVSLDIARVVGALAIDWPTLIARAEQWCAATAVFAAFDAAVRLSQAPVPRAALDALRPRGARAVAVRWLVDASLPRGGKSLHRLPLPLRRTFLGPALVDSPARCAAWLARAAVARALDRWGPMRPGL